MPEAVEYTLPESLAKFCAPSAIESRCCLLLALYSRNETIIRAAANGVPTPAPTMADCCMQTLEAVVLFSDVEVPEVSAAGEADAVILVADEQA